MTIDAPERALANYVRGSECWARASGGKSWSSEGLACAVTPVPRRGFNQIIIRSSDVPDDAIREALTWYTDQGVRFRVRLRDALDEAMKPRLESMGLVGVGGIPAMLLESEMPSGFSSDLDVREVKSDGDVHDMVAVVASAFGWEAPQLGEVFKPAIVADSAWRGWVGYDDASPVASSQIIVHEGVVGLYYVAVLDNHRRKGYGEAITRVAINAGRGTGCDLACLNASEHGYPVYKRLGFRDAGKHLGYVFPDVEE